ncbi:MAG: ferritin-like domain-containing protein [Acidimicrobiia bacterium]
MADLTDAIEQLDPPPLSIVGREEELCAAYEAAFEADKKVWMEHVAPAVERLERGSFSLEWMNTDGGHWGTQVKPSSRGLTVMDINRSKAYGTVAQSVPEEYRNLTPRGSIREPYKHWLPVYDDFVVTERWDLWADNVSTLYEEAKARQWNATKDIAWDELEQLPEDLEKAACQLATFLTEIEFLAGDFPAKWMYRIPAEFYEIKAFLATQIMDEARHLEVFRKRALAGGGGLLHVNPMFEWASKMLMASPTHTSGAYFLNLIGEGFILSVFRGGEFLARTHVDREIFRRCLQDEARHVAFGTIELKNFLENHPQPEQALDTMHRYADIAEVLVSTSILQPTVLEPLAVLMGGGLDEIDMGMDGVAFLWDVVKEEYLQRCDRAGLFRRERCQFGEMPWKAAL